VALDVALDVAEIDGGRDRHALLRDAGTNDVDCGFNRAQFCSVATRDVEEALDAVSTWRHRHRRSGWSVRPRRHGLCDHFLRRATPLPDRWRRPSVIVEDRVDPSNATRRHDPL